mgnify:CR=1 FL=1
MEKLNFNVKQELLDAVFAGLTRSDDDLVFFDKSNGDVFALVDGYFSSLKEDQSISNRHLMNKILNNSPKDKIEELKHFLINQITLMDFLQEYEKQTNSLEPFSSFSKKFPLLLSDKYNGINTTNLKFNFNLINEFDQLFTSAFQDNISSLTKNYSIIFDNTCSCLAYKYLQKNKLTL